MRRGHALSRAGGHVDHHTGFVSILGWRRSVDDFQGLNGVNRNLVGENLALLVRDRLAVHRERILRVVAQAVEKAVRIGRDARRCERHQRAERRRSAFERKSVESVARSTSVCDVESVSSRSPAASTVTVLLAPANWRLILT